MKKHLLLAIATILILFGHQKIAAFCHCKDYLSEFSVIEDRAYIAPSCFVNINNRPHVILNGKALSLQEIYEDEHGCYIPLSALDYMAWCDNGHSTICWFCNGCDVWYCQYHCKCGN